MIKVILNGACGRMGKEVEKLVSEAEDMELCARVDKFGDEDCYQSLSEFTGDVDVIIDFSHHSSAQELLQYASERKIPVIVATTGHTELELALIEKAAEKTAVFHSANMSLGVALLVELAKKAALAMPDADIEIVETHHNRKLDAPSGTALMIANELKDTRENAELAIGRSGMCKREKNEIGVQSVRMGNIPGIHEVLVSTDNQTISLKHEAHSRALFAEGAVSAARFMAGKKAGLYNMKNMIE